MSETYGWIYIKASSEVMDVVLSAGNRFQANTIAALLNNATGSENADRSELNQNLVEEVYLIEGKVEQTNGFLGLSLFGQNWPPLLKALAQNTNGVDVYGYTHTEHGQYQFYCADGSGAAYVGDDEDQWRAQVPLKVKPLFGDMFGEDETSSSDNALSSDRVESIACAYNPEKTSVIYLKFYNNKLAVIDDICNGLNKIIDLDSKDPETIVSILRSTFIDIDQYDLDDPYGVSLFGSKNWRGDFITLCPKLSFVVQHKNSIFLGLDLYDSELVVSSFDDSNIEEIIAKNKAYNEQFDLWGTEGEELTTVDDLRTQKFAYGYEVPIGHLLDECLVFDGLSGCEMTFRNAMIGDKKQIWGLAGEEGLYTVDYIDLCDDSKLLKALNR